MPPKLTKHPSTHRPTCRSFLPLLLALFAAFNGAHAQQTLNEPPADNVNPRLAPTDSGAVRLRSQPREDVPRAPELQREDGDEQQTSVFLGP